DYLNTWLTENPETLPDIRESKAKSFFKVPAEGPDSVVLHILCQRYALFPTGTKRKVIKDWASAEAGVMRAMAIHALLLTRRSNGSRRPQVGMIKEIVRACLEGAGSDVDTIIDESLNEAMLQDPNSPGSSIPASETDMDVDMIGDSDAPEEPTKPTTTAKSGANVIDPSQMETQPIFLGEVEMPAQPKNNRQADKAMRPPIEAVKPELPIDLLPGLTEQISTNLSEPAVDLVQAQCKVREKARLEAAAKVVGKGPATQQEKEPDTDQEIPKEQDPNTTKQEIPQDPAEKGSQSQSQSQVHPGTRTVGGGLESQGSASWFVNKKWYENQLYVLKSMIAYNGTKINQKKGSSIAQRKMGGWQNAWDQ
ncbi:eag, partial [Symbiodinium sp. KB8]